MPQFCRQSYQTNEYMYNSDNIRKANDFRRYHWIIETTGSGPTEEIMVTTKTAATLVSKVRRYECAHVFVESVGYSCPILPKSGLYPQISVQISLSIFTKILIVGDESFHEDRRTDRRNEGWTWNQLPLFAKYFRKAPKKKLGSNRIIGSAL